MYGRTYVQHIRVRKKGVAKKMLGTRHMRALSLSLYLSPSCTAKVADLPIPVTRGNNVLRGLERARV